MTSAAEDRAARLAAEMAEHDQLVVALEPVEALSVIGMLQLALRHPATPAGPAQIAGAVIERIVHAYKLRGPDSTEFARAVSEGARPSADVEPDAAAKLALADLDLVVDERFPPDAFVVMSGDPAHPDRGGDATIVRVEWVTGSNTAIAHHASTGMARCGTIVNDPRPAADSLRRCGRCLSSLESDAGRARDLQARSRAGWAPTPTELLGRRDVVRPAGLVWSGIRVDELERIGYEVLDRAHPDCPCPLEDGEIIGDPVTGRIFVWSRADFDRLAELSRALHDARRRGLPYRPDPQLARVVELLAIDAPSLEVARELSS